MFALLVGQPMFQVGPRDALCTMIMIGMLFDCYVGFFAVVDDEGK